MSELASQERAAMGSCSHVFPVVGCDLQEIAPVAEAMRRHGARYLRAVLAAEELAHLSAGGPPEPASVAGRFAAKEAIFKTLRPDSDDAVSWPSIVIRTDASGAPHVHLTGQAALLSARRGIHAWSVSTSHDGGYAMACVTALEPVKPTKAAQPAAAADKNFYQDTRPHDRAQPEHTNYQRQKEDHIMDSSQIESTVRGVLAEHGKLSESAEDISVSADLYRAGMTSHASVNVMLGLEDEFDIEFPEERLTKATFTSVASISEAVEEICRG